MNKRWNCGYSNQPCRVSTPPGAQGMHLRQRREHCSKRRSPTKLQWSYTLRMRGEVRLRLIIVIKGTRRPAAWTRGSSGVQDLSGRKHRNKNLALEESVAASASGQSHKKWYRVSSGVSCWSKSVGKVKSSWRRRQGIGSGRVPRSLPICSLRANKCAVSWMSAAFKSANEAITCSWSRRRASCSERSCVISALAYRWDSAISSKSFELKSK